MTAPVRVIDPPRAYIARIATPATIGLVGFLTLIDLFATQAILPALAAQYRVAPAAMGAAVNASTMGMALSGLAMAFVGGRINRRLGVSLSLALLSVPTAMLAFAPDLGAFTALRIAQGVFMAAAFSLTMAYLSERCTAAQSATALAAYVTGAVASNLIGRLVAGTLAEAFGVAESFFFFAGLNLAGAVLAALALKNALPARSETEAASAPLAVMGAHLRNACLLKTFAIGFLVLFAFIGVFTYVNFVLARAPIALSQASLGLVYLVFLPSLATTPFAGAIASRFGARHSFYASLGIAIAALPMLVSTSLPVILFGLAAFGVGAFFAQATAAGFVGRAAKSERAAASGLYLSSYYLGGLVGAVALGQVFDRFGWPATVAAVAAALCVAAAFAAALRPSAAEVARTQPT